MHLPGCSKDLPVADVARRSRGHTVVGSTPVAPHSMTTPESVDAAA